MPARDLRLGKAGTTGLTPRVSVARLDADDVFTIGREEFPQFFAKKFWGDYLDVLKHYSLPEKIEITEHLIMVFQLASAFIKTGNEKFEELIELYEDDLLTKYRSRLVAYFKKGFVKYALFTVAPGNIEQDATAA